MSMGVREIGNNIPLRSKNMFTTAFRVFMADRHIDTNVYNKECGTETSMLSLIVCAEKYPIQTCVSESLNRKPTHQTRARTMPRTGLGVVAIPVHLELPAEFVPTTAPLLSHR